MAKKKKPATPEYIETLPEHLSEFGRAIHKERKVFEADGTVDGILGIVCSIAEETLPDPDACWDSAIDNGERIAEAVSESSSLHQQSFFSALVSRLSSDARDALWAELDRLS